MPILRFVHTLAREDDLDVTTKSESWMDYVRRVTDGLPRKAIAEAAGINVSGVSRWLTGASRPSPEKVISFARGLHQSPIEALVAAGYLAESDVGESVAIVQSLAALSDDALIEELHGRLKLLRSTQTHDHRGSAADEQGTATDGSEADARHIWEREPPDKR